MQDAITQPRPVAGANIRRGASRARIVGGVGIVVAVLLIATVVARVDIGKFSTLSIPQPGAPINQPLARIPLPTVITVVLIEGLLALGGLYIAIRQPLRWI